MNSKDSRKFVVLSIFIFVSKDWCTVWLPGKYKKIVKEEKKKKRQQQKKNQAFGYFLFVNCKLFTCAATEDMKIIAFPNVSTCSIYVGISYC